MGYLKKLALALALTVLATTVSAQYQGSYTPGSTFVAPILTGQINASGGVFTGATPFCFEGATNNTFETCFAVADPSADRVLTLPDITGTVFANLAQANLSLYPTAPTAVSASTAGYSFSIAASNATAGTATSGAAAGGALSFTSGNAARYTSGNANGGDINFTTGAGIGTGTVGKVYFNNPVTNFGDTSTYDRIAISARAMGSNAYTGTISSADLTAARTWSLPDLTGTFAMLNQTTQVITSDTKWSGSNTDGTATTAFNLNDSTLSAGTDVDISQTIGERSVTFSGSGANAYNVFNISFDTTGGNSPWSFVGTHGTATTTSINAYMPAIPASTGGETTRVETTAQYYLDGPPSVTRTVAETIESTGVVVTTRNLPNGSVVPAGYAGTFLADSTIYPGQLVMPDAGTELRVDKASANAMNVLGVSGDLSTITAGNTVNVVMSGHAEVAIAEDESISLGDYVRPSATAGYATGETGQVNVEGQVGIFREAMVVINIIDPTGCGGGGCVNTTTDTITLSADVAAQGWMVGDKVIYWNSGGTSITGLTDGKVYFLLSVSTTDVTLADGFEAETPVDLDGQGDDATQYLAKLPIASINPVQNGGLIANGTDNRVLTSVGAGQGANGEANLAFDGSSLTVTGGVVATTTAQVGDSINDDYFVLDPLAKGANQYTGTFTSNDLTTSNKTWTFPDASGTVITTGNTSNLVANETDNRLVTSAGANAGLNGEANLTFDGSALSVTGSASISTTATVGSASDDDYFVFDPLAKGGGQYKGTFTSNDLTTVDKTWTFPDASGTVITSGNTSNLVANETDNRVVTSAGANAGLSGEANLTFDGSALTVVGSASISTTATVGNTSDDDYFVIDPLAKGANQYKGTLTSNDLTTADKTWTFPDASGTVITSGNTSNLVANETDNRIVTSAGANSGLNGETNLTFDGSVLTVTGSISGATSVSATTLSGHLRDGDFVTPVNAVAATATLAYLDGTNVDVVTAASYVFTYTDANLPADNDTVIITDGVTPRTYTFKSVMTPADGEVLIGTADNTARNLVCAIKDAVVDGCSEGTDYQATAPDPLVTAAYDTTGAGTGTLTLTALTGGVAGNSINANVTFAVADFFPDHALEGGLDADTVVVNGETYTFVATVASNGEVKKGANADASALNLSCAINDTGCTEGAGQDYMAAAANAAASGVHSGAGDTIVLTARVKGVAGNSYTLTESSTTFSVSDAWNNTPTGVDGTVCTKGDIRFDSGYIYVCTATNTIADANWGRSALTVGY